MFYEKFVKEFVDKMIIKLQVTSKTDCFSSVSGDKSVTGALIFIDKNLI